VDHFVIDDGEERQLTDRGRALVDQARLLASEAGRSIWETAGTLSPGKFDDIAYEAGYSLAVVAAALHGIEEYDYPMAVVGGVRDQLVHLGERCDAILDESPSKENTEPRPTGRRTFTLGEALDMLAGPSLEVKMLADTLTEDPDTQGLEQLHHVAERLSRLVWEVENHSPKMTEPDRDRWNEIAREREILPAATIGLEHSMVDREATYLGNVGERWSFCVEAIRASAARIGAWIVEQRAAAAEEVAAHV
jgi:hypothetical protein